MSFEPTHTFRGLELEYLDKRGSAPAGRFLDSHGGLYHVPMYQVTELPLKPKPGEVWVFGNATISASLPLRFVDSNGRLVNHGLQTQWDPDFDSTLDLSGVYTKVLNADGTPA